MARMPLKTVLLLKSRLTKALFVLILPMASTFVLAQGYQWRDQQGRVYFGDRPPADANAKALGSGTASSDQKNANFIPFVPPAEALHSQSQDKAKSKTRSNKKKTQQALLKKKRKRRQQCSKAREKYLAFARKRYKKTDLASLKKRRHKRQSLLAKQKKYCD